MRLNGGTEEGKRSKQLSPMSVADIPAGWSVRGDRFPLLQIAVQAFRVMKICSRRDFTNLNHCKKPRRSSTVAKSAGAVFFRERISL